MPSGELLAWFKTREQLADALAVAEAIRWRRLQPALLADDDETGEGLMNEHLAAQINSER